MTGVIPIPKSISWPPATIPNEFGIATLSLGNWREHKLEPRLRAAAKVGYKWIDLFDECWEAYLEEHGLDGTRPWEPEDANLKLARKLRDLVESLGMRIACTQPLRKVEGIKDPTERRESLDLVAKRFPFMHAFNTELVFMCANIRTDAGVTSDLKTVARDLAELGDMAAAYSHRHDIPMLRIGYEGLSWAQRNTWSASWEAVRMADRPNVGVVLDAFNILAVEWADPYNKAGHGRIFPTIDDSIRYLCTSLGSMVKSIPADKIFYFQIGDAELVNPQKFLPPSDPQTPVLLPWSRGHRLYPLETSRGGYMPAEIVAAAVLATGYRGPLSLEVFSNSLNVAGANVPPEHATRGITGLERLVEAVERIPAFWEPSAQVAVRDMVAAYYDCRQASPRL